MAGHVAGQIDRDKLRMMPRRLGDEFTFRTPYEAVELMPPANPARSAGHRKVSGCSGTANTRVADRPFASLLAP